MQSPVHRGGAKNRGLRLNILLTRPREQAEALAKTLAAEGWSPVVHPLLTYTPLEVNVTPGDVAALVFTSVNGVRAAGLTGFDGPVYAVGATTATAARRAGFAQVIAAEGDGADLARLMLSRGEPGPALHFRGRHAAGGLGDILAKAGVDLRVSVVYEMRAAERLDERVRAMIIGREIAAAPFYSERTARVFASLLDPETREGLAATWALAISHEVAQPLRKLGFAKVNVAATPDGAAMLATLHELRS